MKKRAFIIIFFLLLPAVFAGIDIRQDKSNYNLGDKISLSVSVVEDVDVNGFFKAVAECTNYVMQYFVTPISLEKNFRTSINVPDLTATTDMLGSCKIKAIIEETEGAIDSGYTEGFEIKKRLDVSCEAAEGIPGKEVEISCIVKKLSGEAVSDGTIRLNYRKKEFTGEVEAGMSTFSVFVGEDVPAGMQKMAVEAEDTKGNYGDVILEVNVEAIPTRLENRVNKEFFNLGETLEIKPVLYDHIDGFIDATISLEFVDPEGKKLISNDVSSGGTVSYTFNSYSLPGDYLIKTNSEGISQENAVKLESLTKLKMTYSSGGKVKVENVGNLFYDDKTTIVLENEEGKKYMIEKKLNLEPGEVKEIDLSREVPYGRYDVTLPVVSSEEETSASSGEEAADTGGEEEVVSSEEEPNFVENAEIQDNRPVYKKVGSGVGTGFGMVTGAAIGTVGFVSTKPLAASIILVVIILVIVLFYSRDIIKSKIGRVKIKVDKKEGIHVEKQDGEIEGLFKDFEYGKK